jgi:DNA transformation protein and related proteins
MARADEKQEPSSLRTDRLYVNLGASQVRRRLKGHGFGIRRVETAGKNRAVIIHTATGEHLRQLEALFQDVVEATHDENEK